MNVKMLFTNIFFFMIHPARTYGSCEINNYDGSIVFRVMKLICFKGIGSGEFLSPSNTHALFRCCK